MAKENAKGKKGKKVKEAAKGKKNAAAAAETEEQRIDRLVTERLQARLASGDVTPARKGLTGKVDERTAPASPVGSVTTENSQGLPGDWPDRPLHEYSDEEIARYAGTALDHHVFGAKGQAVTSTSD